MGTVFEPQIARVYFCVRLKKGIFSLIWFAQGESECYASWPYQLNRIHVPFREEGFDVKFVIN